MGNKTTQRTNYRLVSVCALGSPFWLTTKLAQCIRATGPHRTDYTH